MRRHGRFGKTFALLLICAATMAGIATFTPAAHAEGGADRVLRFRFTPTARAQIALWIESADGTFKKTVRLTQATSFRGIGNRPGAYAMNSGFRWPYGRREGVLPVWANRRAAAPGAQQFSRVIFQNRRAEGLASRTSDDASRDNYFCLSFDQDTTSRDALDAVSCASVFNSDKGRYITGSDISKTYSEPVQTNGGASMRALSLTSLYPPRRDVQRCGGVGTSCLDHADVAKFQADAKAVMPDIDAVTMATPVGDEAQLIQFDVPSDWPDGDYVAWLEINTEGDYNASFNEDNFPTPTGPNGQWDSWAMSYGYPYRGQPSAVYKLPFSLSGDVQTFSTATPTGAGSIDGLTAQLGASTVLTDNPAMAPGSGADRLRMAADARFSVEIVSTSLCTGPNPPPECGSQCSATAPCATGFICMTDGTCTGYCDMDMPPSAVGAFSVIPHPSEKQSHHWGVLTFAPPTTARAITKYEVRVGTSPIATEADFEAAQPANAASLDSVALTVPTVVNEHGVIEVAFGGLNPETTYFVALRAVDDCNDAGPLQVGSLSTTKINFTTVSPCFIATAAYGTPMADEVNALREFRDRHLMTNGPGRAFVGAYYAVSPPVADFIRARPVLRAAVRTLLNPVVALARWMDGE